MSISKCMQIVNDLRDEDADALLEKVDTYQAAGREAADAAKAAVRDMLAEHAADRKATLKRIREAAKNRPAQEEPDAEPEVSAEGPKASLSGSAGDVDLTTAAGRQRAREEIRRIAGDKVKIRFGKSNQYDWEGHVITLAVSANADIGNAYHEALHAVFKAIDPAEKRELYQALKSALVRNQLKELLKDSPEAYDQAMNDPEELAAYAFQFWKQGKLELGPASRNVFQKIVDLIENVRNWILDLPGADEIFERIADGYYKDGGPSPLELAALRNSKGAARRVMADVGRGMLSIYDKILSAVDDRLRNTGVGELTMLAREFYVQVGEKTERRGLAQEIPIMTSVWLNRLAKLIGSDANEAHNAIAALVRGETNERTEQFRHFLNQMHAYMKDAKVDVGYVENYVPLQWSGDKIRANKDAFVEMLRKYESQLKDLKLTPEKAADMMANRNLRQAVPTGDIYDPETKVPTAHHLEDRVFKFLSNEDRMPFVEDNYIGTWGQYVKQVVKHAEWVRRFGNRSEKFDRLKEQAVARGAKPEDIALVDDLKDAVFGAKYNKMDPTWRRVLGGIQTYQNLRVLGLALFSSVADPLVLGIRTGEFKESWGAFKYGVRHLWKAPEGELKHLAEDIGAINEVGLSDSLMTLYGGFEVEGNFKRANDLLFKLNGLDGLTRALRVYATGAGLRFLDRASDRDLAELGLKRDDLKRMPDGSIAVRGTQFVELGSTHEQATAQALKIQTALNRFVDEGVLRPNAAERPNWANNPTFALLFHLKQFIFSFHKVVSKKVGHEFDENPQNLAPVLNAAAFIPLMAATGYVKDLIQFAGDVPADRGFLHYVGYGVNRSGFLGPGTLAHDAYAAAREGGNVVGAVGGPTASQALEALQAIANPDRWAGFVEEALPLSSVYKRWND